GQIEDVGRQRQIWIARASKMFRIHAATEGKAIRIQLTLGPANFWTASKDYICHGEEFAVAPHHFRRRTSEERKFIHAIVNDRAFVQVTGESSHRHRIVKPLHRRCEISAKLPSSKR